MLFRATGMLNREIHDASFAPKEPAAARAEFERFEEIFGFEDIEAPGLRGWGFAGFGRLVVFKYDGGAGDGVGFGGEFARGCEVGLLFVGRGVWFHDSGVAGWFGVAVEGGLLGGEGAAGAFGYGG